MSTPHTWALTVAGSEITGCGWADVAVGSFQYDLYTEVGNDPGAVYADWTPLAARTPAKGERQTVKVSLEKVSMVRTNLARVNRRNSGHLYAKADTSGIEWKVMCGVQSTQRPRITWKSPAECRNTVSFGACTFNTHGEGDSKDFATVRAQGG